MFMTKAVLQNAAAQIRSADAVLTSIVRDLDDAGVWAGTDADRFQRDWNELVRSRLSIAAGTLDGVSFVTFL